MIYLGKGAVDEFLIHFQVYFVVDLLSAYYNIMYFRIFSKPLLFFISSYRLLATGMVVARSVPLGVMVWLGEVEGEFLLTFLVDMMTPRFLFMVTVSKHTLIFIL